ncbi:MAG TPA: diacylglycerol kinase family protein [Patescibacteria group bacterium]|nr:diacylglycerol kinase family protein [Patescibacteria group bacterium]
MKGTDFFRSFRHAARGFSYAFHMERNFRVQCIIAVLVLIALFLVPLAIWERVILLSMIMTVLVLELLNTGIERLIDLLKPRLDEYVKDVKDVMAAAVLLASIFAVIIGVVIFWPHFMRLSLPV